MHKIHLFFSLEQTTPTTLLTFPNEIDSFDLSCHNDFIAVRFKDNLSNLNVDSTETDGLNLANPINHHYHQNLLQVYHLDLLNNSNQIIFQEPNITSFKFHESVNFLISYSKTFDYNIFVRSLDAENTTHSSVISHSNTGKIVNFNKNLIFTQGNKASGAGGSSSANKKDGSFENLSIVQSEFATSGLIKQLLEQDQIELAFETAKISAEDSDLRNLAEKCLIMSTLESFRIAASCYTKINDLIFLDIIEELSEKYLKSGKTNGNLLCQAEACSYLGLFEEAVEAYRKADALHLARKMYLDLKMFDEAKQFAGSNLGDDEDSGTENLGANDIEDEAKWYEESGEIEKAIEIYFTAGNKMKAITLMGEHKMMEKIITTVRRKLTPSDRKELMLCVNFINKILSKNEPKKARALCIEIYEKCHNYEKLIQLLADENNWAKAHIIAENTQNIDLINETWLKHAHYLAENDEFNAAQKAFLQANRPDEATNVLNKLTKNAIIENRFLDASQY